ncbi:MAG: response regulator transcription factor [Lachnospiraceae bacterium]|nr:response regulator transcription factor [Lachnospiraceae bacterium]
MRILFAEDEKDLNNIITRTLTDEHYSVDSCFNGQEAIDYLEMAEYDVVILDIMMPKKDGYAVLKKIRDKDTSTPVLFLTALDAVEERVKGLDAGANDYLVKPFSIDELLARVRVLARSRHSVKSTLLTCDDLTLDTSSHVVKRGNATIDLSAKEYQLLEYLMYNRGKTLSRQQIEDHIWNYDYEGGTNVVDVYIRYLRRKIDKDYEKKLIHTKRGMGYMLKGDD